MRKTIAVLDPTEAKVKIDHILIKTDNPDWEMEDYVREKYGSYVDWMEIVDNTIYVKKSVELNIVRF